MADTGWVIAGAGATTGGGTAWSNQSGIIADDTNYAQVMLFTGSTSQYLKASSFGLTIPVNATIDGCAIRIQAASNSGTAIRLYAAVWKDDSTAGTDLETGPGTLTSVYTNYDYGGETQLWGLTLTATDVNSEDFQVRFQGYSAGFDVIWVDAIWVRVYYTASASESETKGASAHLIGL